MGNYKENVYKKMKIILSKIKFVPKLLKTINKKKKQKIQLVLIHLNDKQFNNFEF